MDLKKRWLLAGFTSSLALAMTLFLYAPLETYLMNQSEFWFGLSDIALPLCLAAVATIAVLSLICLVLPSKGGIKRVFVGLIFALALSLYLQENFLNPDFGSLGALEIDWAAFAPQARWNAAIWIALLIAVSVACVISKKRTATVISAIACLIFAMQAVALTTLLISYAVTPEETNSGEPQELSREGLYELSSQDGSALVFIVDTMDDVYFVNALEAAPEYSRMFDGFTQFTQCTGSFSTTSTAVPFILTAQYYKNDETRKAYTARTYSESQLLNTLKENNYDTRVFTGTTTHPESLAPYVDNGTNNSVIITCRQPIIEMLMRLVMFKQAPTMFKEKLYVDASNFDELLNEITTSNKFTINDFVFYEDLLNSGLTVINNEKTFRLIHLHATHAPYTMTAEGKKSEGTTSAQEVTLGTLKIIDTFFQKMKEKGIYDNTTIMIVADHSRWRDGDVLMLVKPPYERGEMQVNISRVSHLDIHATLLELMDLPSVDYGENMFDVPENIERSRLFNMCETTEQVSYGDYMPPLWEIELTKDVDEPKYTGVVYTNEGKLEYLDYAPVVTLGRTYSYTELDNFYSYGFFSWGDAEKGYQFANMKGGQMFFKVETVPEAGVDLTIQFHTWMPTSPANLSISTLQGDALYAETLKSTADPIVVHIPSNAFDENNMVILEFYCPDIRMSNDHRFMNLGYKSFIITETEADHPED